MARRVLQLLLGPLDHGTQGIGHQHAGDPLSFESPADVDWSGASQLDGT
jgi:hypothetical protein